MSIVELRQTAEDEWKAKYQGNHGLYTIRITTAGGKTVKFSCTCPSDYHPCKHIPMIEKAIARKLAGGVKQGNSGGLKVEEAIAKVSAEMLRKFIVKQARYNEDLRNAVFLEFAVSAKSAEANKYSGIIRKTLAEIDVSQDDGYFYEETMEIDALDDWLDKAKDCVNKQEYGEAILICKACIEEYSQWLYNVGDEISQAFSERYQSAPFDILEGVVKHANKRELFDYCLAEMKKKNYAGTVFYDEFHRLLATLALKVDPDTFVALQDQLLANIADKTSDEAKTVLRRKIDFYRRLGQAGKAKELLEENIQIVSFRLEVVENKISKRDFGAAKKFINEVLHDDGKRGHYLNRTWCKLLLDIAQKENDAPAVKELTFGFIKDGFEQKYYEIYKATFAPEEWAAEREKLYLRYDKGDGNKKYFSNSAADLLVAEGETERLLNYIEEHISHDNLVKYHKAFAAAYPENTLKLFERVIVSYAEKNIGRSHYEYVFSLLQKMAKVKGGKKEAADLAAVLRLRHKGRRAMLEILQRL